MRKVIQSKYKAQNFHERKKLWKFEKKSYILKERKYNYSRINKNELEIKSKKKLVRVCVNGVFLWRQTHCHCLIESYCAT